MDWTQLAAWIYRDSTIDLAKIRAHKIGTVYVDPRSSNAATVCGALRFEGVTPGLYYSPGWFAGPTPQQHAQKLSDYVQKAGIISGGEPVMVDLELLSPPWVRTFLTSLHAHLPRRPLAYTNCPFQNETVVPVATLAGFGMHWYPQLYYGDTLPDGRLRPADAAAVIAEVARIYPPELVHPFYDGAALPADARDGCVFTLERLP